MSGHMQSHRKVVTQSVKLGLAKNSPAHSHFVNSHLFLPLKDRNKQSTCFYEPGLSSSHDSMYQVLQPCNCRFAEKQILFAPSCLWYVGGRHPLTGCQPEFRLFWRWPHFWTDTIIWVHHKHREPAGFRSIFLPALVGSALRLSEAANLSFSKPALKLLPYPQLPYLP